MSVKEKVLRLGIIGAGPHFRERYHPMLQLSRETVHRPEITFVVDLESTELVVCEHFQDSLLSPTEFVFIDKKHESSPRKFKERLSKLATRTKTDAVLICSEPRSHYFYIAWAISEGINVFVDKPITMFPGGFIGAYRTRRQFKSLLDLERRSSARITVSSERRSSPVYDEFFRKIAEFENRFGFPATQIDCKFGAGKLLTQSEYSELENHSFKYGLGLLSHSGYHYVDIVGRLISRSKKVFNEPLQLTTLKVTTRSPTAIGASYARSSLKFIRAFGNHSQSNNQSSRLGESALSAIGKYETESGLCTSFSLIMSGETVSTRDHSEDVGRLAPSDGGRARSEEVSVHFGSFASIYLRSLPIKKLNSDFPLENYQIEILENPRTTSIPKNYLKIDRCQMMPNDGHGLSTGHANKYGRERQLLEFIEGSPSSSALSDHQESMDLMIALIRQI